MASLALVGGLMLSLSLLLEVVVQVQEGLLTLLPYCSIMQDIWNTPISYRPQ